MAKKEGFFFTGVGARVTPDNICADMTRVAGILVSRGGILRTGGQQKGADAAWTRGAGFQRQTFKPPSWQREGDYPTLPAAYIIAARHHPRWDKLDQWDKDLLARNAHCVLGPKLDDPSEYLLGWTEDGVYDAKFRTSKTGGTGHAIAIACAHGVPVFNMNNKVHYKYIMETLIK